MKKALKKHTLLVGEGIHQHTLYGSFAMELEVPTEFPQVLVKEDSQLKHEKPNGSWSNEHKTLIVEKGDWVMGKQVEFNPFNQMVTRVWD
jgi:hypothetical protein